MDNAVKQRIFAFIDSAETFAVELETELTARPAVSPDSGGEGENAKAEYLEGWLAANGFAFERMDVPDGRAKGGVRPNIMVILCPDDAQAGSPKAAAPGGKLRCNPPAADCAPCLWVMSHLDVVPPGERSLWESDPWTVIRRDGDSGSRLVGRGVEDNQQGLVSSLIAALAIREAGLTPSRPVRLLFCADEECGSEYGVGAILKRRPELFGERDMVLIPDGGDDRGETIEIAEKNLLWVEFTTRGRQAHGSRPDLGVNAHLAGAELAVRLHDRLSELFCGRDPLFEPDCSTFQPTRKNANVPNINTIPGEDVFCMDMRILPRYPAGAVLAEIDRIKAEVEAKRGVMISYTTPQSVESPPTPANSPLVAALSRAAKEVFGADTRPVGIGGGTVASFFRRKGIHCAVWSCLDDTAHQPNEYALVANILGGAKVMALLMMDAMTP